LPIFVLVCFILLFTGIDGEDIVDVQLIKARPIIYIRGP
jgi:hypothetical protein